MTDGVVLFHGILRTKRSMASLEQYLTKAGYATLNVGYPSNRHSLEDLTELLHDKIQAFITTLPGHINFVGHSMGGLLIRAYIKHYPPKNLGRVVMLGTPNHGSEIADLMKNWWIYKLIYGESGQQLITSEDGFKYTLGDIHYELGVIAGDRSFDLISSKVIGKPNDGKVSVESTKIPGMTDHIIVHASHTLMLMNETVRQQVLHFLRYGRFLHAA